MREPDFKPMTGGFRNLHVKLLTLLPSTVAIESIAILDTDDIQGQLHKSFISITHARTCARAHTHTKDQPISLSRYKLCHFSVFSENRLVTIESIVLLVPICTVS